MLKKNEIDCIIKSLRVVISALERANSYSDDYYENKFMDFVSKIPDTGLPMNDLTRKTQFLNSGQRARYISEATEKGLIRSEFLKTGTKNKLTRIIFPVKGA